VHCMWHASMRIPCHPTILAISQHDAIGRSRVFKEQRQYCSSHR
jgi:hypothetical protein